MKIAIPIFIILFFVFAEFLFVSFFERNFTKRTMKNDIYTEETEPDFMILRNGFGVTSDKHPTVAQQWVNIMNYTGENQTEVDYEETAEAYTAENLG